MDSFEWNKIIGAVLATALFAVALNILVGGLMTPHKAEKPGIEVAGVEDHSTTGGPVTPTVEAKPDWGTVLPAADVTAGQKLSSRCQTCHDFTKGGPNKIGPNLYGVLGGKHAHMPDFAYSPAMTAAAASMWGYDEINEFIKNPKAVMPGTKMAFAGLSKLQDRINLIAYLRTLADAPMAIPAPNPATPTDTAAEPPAGELQAPPPAQPAPETPAPANP